MLRSKSLFVCILVGTVLASQSLAQTPRNANVEYSLLNEVLISVTYEGDDNIPSQAVPSQAVITFGKVHKIKLNAEELKKVLSIDLEKNGLTKPPNVSTDISYGKLRGGHQIEISADWNKFYDGLEAIGEESPALIVRKLTEPELHRFIIVASDKESGKGIITSPYLSNFSRPIACDFSQSQDEAICNLLVERICSENIRRTNLIGFGPEGIAYEYNGLIRAQYITRNNATSTLSLAEPGVVSRLSQPKWSKSLGTYEFLTLEKVVAWSVCSQVAWQGYDFKFDPRMLFRVDGAPPPVPSNPAQ